MYILYSCRGSFGKINQYSRSTFCSHGRLTVGVPLHARMRFWWTLQTQPIPFSPMKSWKARGYYHMNDSLKKQIRKVCRANRWKQIYSFVVIDIKLSTNSHVGDLSKAARLLYPRCGETDISEKFFAWPTISCSWIWTLLPRRGRSPQHVHLGNKACYDKSKYNSEHLCHFPEIQRTKQMYVCKQLITQ